MLSVSIIVFFTLVVLSIAGIVYCMIRGRFSLGDKLELALIGFSSVFFALCCVFVDKGLTNPDDPHARGVDTLYVCPSLPERSLLILSIMSVESNFNPKAKGSKDDTGILQIRQIYVDEVNRILGYDKYTLDDAYDIDKSLDMFDVLQSHHNKDNDFIKTIYYHNKSDAYQLRVVKEYNRLLLYERMRDKLVKRYNNKNQR